jgi:hypothetical protein
MMIHYSHAAQALDFDEARKKLHLEIAGRA